MAKFRFPGYDPRVLDPQEIARILANLDRKGADFEGELGSLVRVTEGPFNGLTGRIEEIIREREKLRVTINIFGRATPVELEYQSVVATR